MPFTKQKYYNFNHFQRSIDVSEKTVSEEYTPLHLAARFNSYCYDHSTDEQGSEGSEGALPNTASGAEESQDGPQTTSTRQLRRLASIEQVLNFLMDNQKVDVCWECQ